MLLYPDAHLECSDLGRRFVSSQDAFPGSLWVSRRLKRITRKRTGMSDFARDVPLNIRLMRSSTHDCTVPDILGIITIGRGLLQKIGYRGDASGWGSLVSVSVTTETSGPRQSRTPPELQVKTKRLRWLLGLVGLVLVGGIGAGIVLSRHWPYSEAQVVPGLQSTFKTTVTIGGYR